MSNRIVFIWCQWILGNEAGNFMRKVVTQNKCRSDSEHKQRIKKDKRMFNNVE